MDLWSLENQRKISLRFLASYLLGEHIQVRRRLRIVRMVHAPISVEACSHTFPSLACCQGETHDSIEDARTALRLYEKYLEVSNAIGWQTAAPEHDKLCTPPMQPPIPVPYPCRSARRPMCDSRSTRRTAPSRRRCPSSTTSAGGDSGSCQGPEAAMNLLLPHQSQGRGWRVEAAPPLRSAGQRHP